MHEIIIRIVVYILRLEPIIKIDGEALNAIATVLGFAITYLGLRKTYKDGLKSQKRSKTLEKISDEPNRLLTYLDSLLYRGKSNLSEAEKDALINDIINKIIAYGSKECVRIALRIEDLKKDNASGKNPKDGQYDIVYCVCLLLAQLKLDISDELMLPTEWIKFKLGNPVAKDGDSSNNGLDISERLNVLIDELRLNPKFKVKKGEIIVVR